MKDDFSTVIQNHGIIRETLTDTMKAKNPYTIMQVVTTGDKDSDGERILRVFAEHYEYNESKKEYAPVITFDHVLEGTKESKAALKKAADKAERCELAGISEADYLAGNGVLSEEEFQQKFRYFADAVQNSGTILANDLQTSLSALQKLGLAHWLRNRMYAATAFDQERIKADLMPAAAKDTFAQMAEREYQTKLTSYRDVVAVLQKMITAYGEREDLLQDSAIVKILAEAKEARSEEGRTKYQNGTVEDKLNVWLNTNVLQPVVPYAKNSRQFGAIHTPNMDALTAAIQAKQPMVFMQCSTTGLAPTDVPIACTLIALTYDSTTNRYVKASMEANGHKKKFVENMLIRGNANAVMKAREKELKGGFPIFARAGIDYDAYIRGEDGNGAPVATEQEAKTRIAQFFQAMNEQYPKFVMISNGCSSMDKTVSFSGAFLMKLGGIAELRMPFIDGAQFLKEYAYEKFTGNRIFNDNIIDFSTWTGKQFGLEDFFAHYTDGGELHGCADRASFTAQLVTDYAADIESQKQGTLVAAVEETDAGNPTTEDSAEEPIADIPEEEEAGTYEPDEYGSLPDEIPDEIPEEESEEAEWESFESFEPDGSEPMEPLPETQEKASKPATMAFSFGGMPSLSNVRLREQVPDGNQVSRSTPMYGETETELPVVSAEKITPIGSVTLPSVTESESYQELLMLMQTMMRKVEVLTEKIEEQQEQIDRLTSKKNGKGIPEE